jgi:hypothetical protein
MRGILPAALLVGCRGDVNPTCDSAPDGLDVVADTYFDGSIASHGNTDTLLVGNGNRALLRFFLGPDLRASELRFVLTLTEPGSAEDCMAGCGPCQPIAPSGSVTASLVRSDWDEATASHEIREQVEPWSAPGPDGADVLELAATSATASGTALSIGFNALGLSIDPDWPADEVSVLISPLGNVAVPVRYSTRENACEPATAPRLTATCQ